MFSPNKDMFNSTVSKSKSRHSHRPSISLNDQIKGMLEQLENYSLKSSEEINDDLESLVSCIASNTVALEKSLKDLADLK
jgi:hypothetical protein